MASSMTDRKPQQETTGAGRLKCVPLLETSLLRLLNVFNCLLYRSLKVFCQLLNLFRNRVVKVYYAAARTTGDTSPGDSLLD
jgi:hypothetical protein